MTSVAAVLEIDLDVIAGNWRLLRDRHAPGETAAVVKADGYGLGAVTVGRRLFAEGCRHFFTAHLDEALRLRDAVPGGMIAALNGLWRCDAGEYVARDITPVLGSLAELEVWAAQARQIGRTLPAILHVDTGMNRLGLDARELAALAAEPGRLDGIDLRYVMSHLVSSDLPRDPMNLAQRYRFERARAVLPQVQSSFAASSGIFLGAEFRSDLARPGAAIYGINPTPDHPNPMRNPVRLLGRVLQVREIGAGERVGYNGIWRATRPSRIATLSIGYADGLPRRLSNGMDAFFDGKAVPLVGRVTMDLTTYDVTDHPGVVPGTWLELMGCNQNADQLAVRAGTNGYEILTALGCRYRRHYLPN